MPKSIRRPNPPRRRRRPPSPLVAVLAAAGLCLLLLAGALWLLGRHGETEQAAIGGPFQLVDGTGKPVTDRDLRGQYLLIYFGYTYCPDVCPTTLQEVSSALDTLGSRADAVRPVFITVDPGRDTPPVIGTYVAAFSPRLIGLTGSADQIGAIEREYRVYSAVHRTGPGKDDYSMDHSSVLYLMAPDGHFIAPLPADEKGPALAADLARHLS